jgi:hypothetical protein
LSEKPFSTAIMKAETICGAKFRGKYHTVICNVRIFSYVEKLLTERKKLQALMYPASTLGSLLHKGGSLVIEDLVGYSIGTPLDAFVDVVHLLASDFADAKCVKTAMHSNNPRRVRYRVEQLQGGQPGDLVAGVVVERGPGRVVRYRR